MAGSILRCFINADLRNGHDGLSQLAKKDGVDVDRLSSGQYLVFVNTAKNKMKIYTANQVVAYMRLKRGHIDMAAISKIPESFQGNGEIAYDSALRSRLEIALKVRRHASALEIYRSRVRAGV